jgi:hypothetical protein
MINEAPSIINELTQLINAIYTNKIPTAFMTLLSGGNITPMQKPNNDIRPIISQEILLRLTGRVAAREQKKRLAEVLEPLQLGAGTPCGAELIARAVDYALRIHPTTCCLELDLTNAFGLVSRSAIRRELVRYGLPTTFFDAVYGPVNTHTVVLADGVVQEVIQGRGLLQGDPMSPSYFALAFLPALKAAQTAAPSTTVRAYLDDPFIQGSPEDVMKAFDALQAEAAKADLHINTSKAKILAGAECQQATIDAACKAAVSPQHFPTVKSARVLGSYAGDTDEVRAAVIEIVEEINGQILLLDKLPAQGQALLLRNCMIPKVTHLLRTLPLDIAELIGDLHDINIMASLNRMAGSFSKPTSTLQATLPIGYGGLGLLSSKRTAWAANLPNDLILPEDCDCILPQWRRHLHQREQP